MSSRSNNLLTTSHDSPKLVTRIQNTYCIKIRNCNNRNNFKDLENDAIVATLDLVDKYNTLTKPARKIESIYQIQYK